jgi:hypothetical protein
MLTTPEITLRLPGTTVGGIRVAVGVIGVGVIVGTAVGAVTAPLKPVLITSNGMSRPLMSTPRTVQLIWLLPADCTV